MSRPGFSTLDAVFWTVALTAALVGAITLLQSLAPALGHVAVLGAVEVALYAGAIFLLREPRSPRPLAGLGLARAPLWMLAAGLALGVSLNGVLELVQLSVERAWPSPEAVLEERLVRLRGADLGERALLFAAVCVLAPAAEELYFRGALHSRLAAGYDFFHVAWTTSILFAVSHLEPRIWPSLAIVGFTLAWLRQRSGSILPGYLLHGAFNATTLFSVWLAPEPRADSPPAMIFALASSLATAALLVVLFRRRSEGLPRA